MYQIAFSAVHSYSSDREGITVPVVLKAGVHLTDEPIGLLRTAPGEVFAHGLPLLEIARNEPIDNFLDAQFDLLWEITHNALLKLGLDLGFIG